MKGRIDTFLYKKEKSLWKRTVLLPLYLLSLPYGWGVRLRILLYDLGLRKPNRLPCPVISVGNITVGGTGKTPLVMALAQGLKGRGVSVAVLTRGYKGKGSGNLVSDGQTVFLSPGESGDEPYLMAKALGGIPVLVGKDRFTQGQMALQRFHLQGFLLDDGFQHLQLHRDLNILLIDASIGFGDHHLLPRGLLREPLSHLRRADLFLLTKVEALESCQPLEVRLRDIHPPAPVFHSHYEPLGLVGPGGEWEALETLKGKKILAFSGIANPRYFVSLLKKCGLEVIKEEIFPDHYVYNTKDLAEIAAKSQGLDWIVTTEKDMVRLNHLNTSPLPIRALQIRVRIREEEAFFQRVIDLFLEKKGNPS